MSAKLNKIDCVGIVIKQNMPQANELALEAAQFLKKRKCKVAFAMESKQVCDLALGMACMDKEDLIKKCQLILILGGDGTFISVARLMQKQSLPLLGVNMGQLGFLTEVKRAELFQALDLALEHRLPISSRTMLEVTVTRAKKILLTNSVVNDAVITKGEIARIFDIEVFANGDLVSNIKGDGLIISTPTGSTAYCLAAGGPILEPSVPAVALTAICPHSLTLRPLVLHDETRILVIPRYKSGTVLLTLDGQKSIELQSSDEIKVTKFKRHALQILHWPKRDYFSLLREKLKYGYRD